MFGKDKIFQHLSEIIKKTKDIDSVISSLYRSRRQVTKFAASRIIQNLEEESANIYIKVVQDGKTGVSVCDRLDTKTLQDTLHRAIQISKIAPKNPLLSVVSKPGKVQPVETFFPQTVQFAKGENYNVIKKLLEITAKHKLELTGSLVSGEDEMAVVTSQGVQRYQPFTAVSIKLIPANGNSTGFASALSRNVDKVNFEQTLERAIEKCLKNTDQQDIELGEYDCILEPQAVAEILEWLGFIGFGAKSFYEKTGFTSGNIGQRILGENITICDDGLNPEGFAMPFDFEGSPREKVMLVDKGICRGFVSDNHYGAIYHKHSTGHALPPDQAEGPFPLNLDIGPGTKSTDEMIKMVSRGILITRFHYVNGFLDPHHALMTGLTRDGTFLIEDGKIKRALKNVRFTQPMLKALSQVKAVSKQRKLAGDPSSIGAALVPSLLIEKFTFTGKT